MCKKGSIFHTIRWKLSRKQVLFSINNNLSFLEVYLLRKILLQLIDAMSWPKTHNGKLVLCTQPLTMSKLHYNWWEANQFLMAIFEPPLEVLTSGYGWIYKITCGETSNIRQYEITIRNFLACSCLDIVTMVLSSLGKWRKWVPCKHMYYVLQHVMFMANMKFSFTSWLGVAMKFVTCWLILLLLWKLGP